jgi:transposase-like protein
MFRGINIIEFTQQFSSEDICLQYLSEIKWKEGFSCRKCNHTNYCKGKSLYSRRCTKCKYDESVTTGTIFEKLKFSIVKAFHIMFAVSTCKKGSSSYHLSRSLSLRQPTCWAFRRKAVEAMKSSGNYKLKGNVEVDEFVIGGPEKGMQGRSIGKKRIVVIAVEGNGRGIYRSYAKVIENSSTKQLKPFFEECISKESKIKTDKWRGYNPIKKDYNVRQVTSKNGKNFKRLHRHIMLFKSWMRGIHHSTSKTHLQSYLNEFNFRFNRLNSMDTIFHNLVNRMVKHKPFPFKMLKISGT